jgi:hypothetical protein
MMIVMLATNLESNHHGKVMQETKTKILVCNAGLAASNPASSMQKTTCYWQTGASIALTKRARLVFRAANQPEIHEELKPEKHGDAVARILDDLQAGASAALQSPENLEAVVHCVVHGGDRYTSAVRITAEVPGRAEGNWSCRCIGKVLSAVDFRALRDPTKSTNRLRMLPTPPVELAEAGVRLPTQLFFN